MSMRFQDTDGKWKRYPHSFSEKDLRDLSDFLDQQSGVVPYLEIATNRDRGTVGMRHDVDHSLVQALRFAQWEYERGFRSSYYLLHTAYYYKDKVVLYRSMSELIALGHEVGLHLNGYEVGGSPIKAAYVLREELKELREAGFEILGSAAHGGSGEEVDLILFKKFGYNPSDFGLEYEAYELVRQLDNPKAYYISDNRGILANGLQHVVGKQTMMTLHPCHWPV